jgi:hypothetical protein
MHFWLSQVLSEPQLTHVTPFFPQRLLVVPGWQVPEVPPWQHPLAQEVALHAEQVWL